MYILSGEWGFPSAQYCSVAEDKCIASSLVTACDHIHLQYIVLPSDVHRPDNAVITMTLVVDARLARQQLARQL